MAENGEHYKKRGNAHFADGRYDDAVVEYTTAIIKSPNNAVYYTNRGLSHLKLGRYDDANNDCEKACELDPKSVKAHYFLGQGLSRTARYDKAVTVLRKGYSLAISQRSPFAVDLCSLILVTRRQRWEAKERFRIESSNELLMKLEALLEAEMARKIKSLPAPPSADAIEKITYEHEDMLSQLKLVFAQADENLKVRTVPDAFIDKISFNIMQDPVAAPSGVSFERTQILAHLKQIGGFDPFTRAPLSESDLVPNLALKEAMEEWLSKNEWAADY